MRKRKTTYPVARTSRRPAGPAGAPEQQIRTTVASIDLSAGQGRDGFTTGSRVRITGVGLYSGEEATVESQVLNGPAVNASERVRLSPETTQAVSHPVNPDYPLLARQMKVQGSVILQALIGRDGSIQDLRVVSGPAILAAAAREAVKQWRFKPYLQDGSPIETQARIIVNFTISTT